MDLSKFAAFHQYPPRSLEAAEATLLTVWRSLERFHDDLVLIGGLAIHHLVKKEVPGLPGAVTQDVDLGIALGAEGSQYGSISTVLEGLGFVRTKARFEREEEGGTLYVDLLAEDPRRSSGSVIVDDAPASLVLGLNRALACRRTITLQGKDLFGVSQQCALHVADIGPMLVLKLNAFGGPTGRRAPKDAYDILLAVSGFVDGYRAALERFKAEKDIGNPGMATALACLEADFCDPNRDGPARAAAFHPGGAEERERVRQDLVTVGRALLGA